MTEKNWWDRTWNTMSGCSPISEGCQNCWAKRTAETRLRGRFGYPQDEPFKPVIIHKDKFREPYHWKKPQKIFVCSMSDLFHESASYLVHKAVIEMACACPQHTFMLLTKRPHIMQIVMRGFNWIDPCQPRPLHNVWLGVTAENQRTADERIPILLQIPAAKRFVSVEPMLEPIRLSFLPHPYYRCGSTINALTGEFLECMYDGGAGCGRHLDMKLDWVIAGPETGPHARPCSVDWVRDLQRQCSAAGVPFFDKKDVLGETIQEWPR